MADDLPKVFKRYVSNLTGSCVTSRGSSPSIGREEGASTVKWTTLDACSGLSESDPKLYTNFEFHEIEIHKHLQSQSIYVHTKKYSNNVYLL